MNKEPFSCRFGVDGGSDLRVSWRGRLRRVDKSGREAFEVEVEVEVEVRAGEAEGVGRD